MFRPTTQASRAGRGAGRGRPRGGDLYEEDVALAVRSGERAEGGLEVAARVVQAAAGRLPAQLERAGLADANDAIIVDLAGGEPGDAGLELGVERDGGGGLAGLGVDDPQRRQRRA